MPSKHAFDSRDMEFGRWVREQFAPEPLIRKAYLTLNGSSSFILIHLRRLAIVRAV